jgi:hypothetical protein
MEDRGMKGIITSLAALGLVLAGGQVLAQQLFVYPQKGQNQQQQDIDSAECTRWAKGQSGIDPNAPKQQEQLGTHTRGTAGGAAKGAAVGAAVGAIGGNAGKGAAAGAVVGGVAGRRGSRRNMQAAEAETTNTYQRAFAACMEGRGYTVK